MTQIIQNIEKQILELQKTLNELKNQKLQVSRNFTGQYFAPYLGCLYRRMESDGIPIWEIFMELKKEWVILDAREAQKLESTFKTDCAISSEYQKAPQEEPEELKQQKVKKVNKSYATTSAEGGSSAVSVETSGSEVID